MNANIERRLRELERLVADPRDYAVVITRRELEAMSPAEKVDAYRQMCRGSLVLETGRDPVPQGRVGPPRWLR